MDPRSLPKSPVIGALVTGGAAVTDPVSGGAGWWMGWGPGLVLLVIPLLLYAGAWDHGLFVLDDGIYYANPALHGGAWSGLFALWGGFYFNDYIPVTQTTQWLDLACGDGRDWRCAHAQNAVWLGCGAWAMFAGLARLIATASPSTASLVPARRLAWTVALLTVVHPLCANAVLWLAERKNLVAIACLWWSLERYLAWRITGGRGRWLAAFTLGVAALLAKTHAVALPVVMAAWEITLARDSLAARLRGVLPMVLVTAAAVVIVLSQRQDFAGFWFGGGLAGALWCDGDLLMRYLGQVLHPVRLTVYYPADEDPAHLSLHLLAWTAVAATVAFTLALARRRRLALCAWLMALAALLPALNLVPQAAPTSDHYVQWSLPLIILAGAVAIADRWTSLSAWAVARGARVGPAPVVVVAGLALQFAWLSVQRVPEFASQAAFFAHAAEAQPCAINLAGVLIDEVRAHGRYQPAIGGRALAVLEMPDARRLLDFTLLNTEVEGGVEAWRRDGRAAAAHAIQPLLGLANLPDEQRWINAKILIGASALARADAGPGRLDEADAMLVAALGGDLMAQAAAIAPRCRDGAVLPDGFPPLVTLPADPSADAHARAVARNAHLRLLLVLADVRVHAGYSEQAFGVCALALNLEPDDDEARMILANLYTRLGRKDAAQRLMARSLVAPAREGG